MAYDYDKTLEDNQSKIKTDKASATKGPKELQNLAFNMLEEELEAIGTMVCHDYHTDEDSRSEWLDTHDQWVRLYFQKDVPIQRPWEGSSEESIPILAEAVNQTSARFKKAFFPGRDRIIKALPVGKVSEEDIERAERISYHMSWQCMVKNKKYRKDKRRLLQDVPLHGSAFTKTWYDPVKGEWVVRNVRAIDFIVPYGRGPREVEELERKTEIIWMSVNQTRKHKLSGYFIDYAEAFTRNDGHGESIQQSHDEIEGVSEGITVDSSTPVKILEQHRFLDLDGDGIEEPYIVTVDAENEKVLRISQRWDEDDKTKEPVEFYTHYYFMENPDGFYGLGFGHLVGSANKAVNKILRQGIDAGTLANTNTGFISEQIGIRGGEIETQLGVYKKVNASAQDIKNGIITLDHKGPNPGLIQLMDVVTKRADRLAMVTDALTGQTDKVMQPTTILALVEQGLQQFSASLEGLVDSWSLELQKIYRLNRKYLDEIEYFAVLDSGPQQMVTGKADYADDLQVMPVADPKHAAEQQKLTRAEAEWQFVTNNLLINPMMAAQMGMQISPMGYYEASKRYLEALDIVGIDKLLQSPEAAAAQQAQQAQEQQEQQQQSQGPIPPEQEHVFALMPQPNVPPVRPEDDHQEHYAKHMDFLRDPDYGTRMTPEGEKQMTEHTQMHVAMMYGIEEANMSDVLTPEGQPALTPAGIDGAGGGNYGAQA